MGVETEYAYSGSLRDGTPIPKSEILSRLLDGIKTRCPSLPCPGGGGFFLANGGRFYIDCSHPEYATPECADPWTAARYVRAGEYMLTKIGALLAPRWGPGARVSFFRFQVDCQHPGITWGCHESYLYRSTPHAVQHTLIPHLVSRVLYAGAGGFNPKSDGIEFTASPRAWVLDTDISADSTGNRAILHTRDEPHASNGWKRLHLICGESLGSDLASVLRLGTTALVVAAVEAGAVHSSDVALTSPLLALRAFAADPTGSVTARLARGGAASAFDLQWTYLRTVEKLDAAGEMPRWAGALCELWRRTLEQIENDPASLSRSLDWALKKELLDRWLERQLAEAGLGMDWVKNWTIVLNNLRRGLAGTENQSVALGPLLQGVAKAPPLVIEKAKDELAGRGVSLETLPLFLDLRKQLQEIDIRVGEIDRGILDEMTRNEQLDHRLFDDIDVARAVEQPPSVGRASLRGRAVRDLSDRGPAEGWAGWTRVTDLKKNRVLALDDPWQEEPSWVTIPASDRASARSRQRLLFDFPE